MGEEGWTGEVTTKQGRESWLVGVDRRCVSKKYELASAAGDWQRKTGKEKLEYRTSLAITIAVFITSFDLVTSRRYGSSSVVVAIAAESRLPRGDRSAVPASKFRHIH